MTRLSLHGAIYDVPLEGLVTWVVGTLVNPFWLVGELHWAQQFAMPGRERKYILRTLDETVLQLRTNAAIIDEPEISQAVQSVLPNLEAIVAAAKRIENWQETHVPKKMRTTHNKAVREHGPIRPPWYYDEGFKSELAKSSSAISQYLNALTGSIEIIRVLCPTSISDTVFEQLDRVQKLIPDARITLELGYEEAIRRKATSMDSFER